MSDLGSTITDRALYSASAGPLTRSKYHHRLLYDRTLYLVASTARCSRNF
jgi:hypothetical protein